MAHIGPHVKPEDWPRVSWAEGASVLEVSKGGHCEAVGGGVRGNVHGFSDESRRRLLRLIGRVRRDADLPMFITLTWPGRFPSARESKRELRRFAKRIDRQFPSVGLVWKIEPQERGAPHFHMLAWGVSVLDLRLWVPEVWHEIAGQGDWNHYLFHAGCLPPYRHCVEPVRTWRGVWFYAAKYLGKPFKVTGWQDPGRFWGKINPENIPFGAERSEELSHQAAVELQRYQRRFAHLRPYGRSMTTFCDADQWVDKLIRRRDG